MSTKGYRNYVLFLLTLTYTFSLVDQSLMGILAQPIQDEFNLSDTDLGFLTGAAFALLYGVLPLPVAQWADRGNRAVITSVAIALCGATVALTFFVRTFAQLVFARISAALGAAGCMPGSCSLVGDYFPGSVERNGAMSIYMLANPVSALAAFVLGGWISQHYGWRASFLILGAPALLLAVVVWLTVGEPRGCTRTLSEAKQSPPHLLGVMRFLWNTPSTRNLTLGLVIFCVMAYGMTSWYAPFLMRSHQLTTSEAGLDLGGILGFGGILGILLGGYVCTRGFARDESSQMRMFAVTIVAQVPLFGFFLLAPATVLSLTALTMAVVMDNVLLGPSFALLQRLVPPEIRATSMALVMMLCNVIGMSVGPQIIGIGSDLLRADLGSESLRYAMLIASSLAIWSAYHLWRVGRSAATDLVAVQANALN